MKLAALAITLTLLLSSSLSASLSAAEIPPTVTIQKGESLRDISERVYGTRERWNDLYQLNKDVLKSPHETFPGIVLRTSATSKVDSKPKPRQSARAEIAKPELAKPELAKPELAKPELAKPEPAKPEPAKPQPAKPQPAKSDSVKQESVKYELVPFTEMELPQ